MSTLIAYGTKYGCTQRCAKMLAEKLTGEVHVCNIKKEKPDLASYEQVIIGGSVYIGSIRKEVSEFCKSNLEALKGKKLGLFTCGMRDETCMQELEVAFPKELLAVAKAKDNFGGEFVFKKMNGFERLIVKKVAQTDKDVLAVKEDNINSFAQIMNS